MSYIAFAIAVIYVLIGEYINKIDVRKKTTKEIRHQWHSFTTGVLIAGLFLVFFDEVYKAEGSFILLIITAISFTLFYGLNRYQTFCEEGKNIKKLLARLKVLKFSLRSVHHLLIGILFAEWAALGTLNLIVFAIPVIFLKTVGTFELARNEKNAAWYRIFVEAMVFVGFFIGLNAHVAEWLFLPAIAFVAGGIFYAVVARIFARMHVRIMAMIAGELLFAALVFLPMIW